jgi:5-methylcytosine-specific restriction endonuclease McrA
MECIKGCGRTDGDSEFVKNKNICKPCNIEYHRQYRAKNRERINQQARDRYANDEDKRKRVLSSNRKWRENNSETYNEYRKDYNKRYWAENTEEQKARVAKWRVENSDKVKEYSALYYQANRDSILEYNKVYYEANRERLSASYKDWYWNRGGREKSLTYQKSNPEAYKGYANLRRARKYDPTAALFSWPDILDRDGEICYHCGSTDNLEQDHLIPISKDGKHRFDNVSVLCGTCNRSKGSRLPSELPEEMRKSVEYQIERIKDEPR